MANEGEVEIEVTVPGLLSDCTGGRARFPLRAATPAGAIRQLIALYPLLRVHLYDEQARLRKHVLVFYNGESIAYLPTLDTPLRAGDTLDIVQNVSGG